MANQEYPDLPFIQARAFGKGRDGFGNPRVIVIHYTAGSERSTSAEDGAAYDQRRTDGTSCHYFVDQNSIVQCVYTWDRANSAFYNGNRIGIQYELCGTQQTRAQWLDDASSATLTLAAWQAARDAKKYGIPAVKLTPAQVAAGNKGICGHADITLAFPQDGGDHMDPGAEFPWDVFLPRVQQFMDGGGFLMALSDQDQSNLMAAITRIDGALSRTDNAPPFGYGAGGALGVLDRGVGVVGDLVAGLHLTLSDADRDYIAAQVLAQMPKFPTADEIAEVLASRLGNG